jgi:hypothetical protein
MTCERKVRIDPEKAHPTVRARMAARTADPRELPAERELARRIMAPMRRWAQEHDPETLARLTSWKC